MKTLALVSSVVMLLLFYRNQAKVDIPYLYIGQSVPSDVTYLVDKDEEIIAKDNQQLQTKLGLKFESEYRFSQVGDDLFVWKTMGFDSLRVFSSKGQSRTIPLEVYGDVYFVAKLIDGYMSG